MEPPENPARFTSWRRPSQSNILAIRKGRTDHPALDSLEDTVRKASCPDFRTGVDPAMMS
jgi:hypothetical protein